MKKLLVLTLTFALMLTLAISAIAVDDPIIVDPDANIRNWFCWEQDGNEINYAKIKTSDRFIVKDYSSNWEVKAQGAQNKVTDTYWSPATVWTKDASKVFEIAFDVFGGTKVEIGFLHCVGAAGSGVTLPCSEDGHELAAWCKLYESADGETWTEVDADILPQTNALVSGMTDYDVADITPYNGNGTDEYSEKYFVISGTVAANAKYVKYSFAGNGRSHYWDPCVRDAIFTAPAGEVWPENAGDEPEDPEEPSEEPSDKPADPWVNVAEGCSYEVISGTIRNGGYGDPGFTVLTDSFWSPDGTSGIGALDSGTATILFNLGEVQPLKKIKADVWELSSWGIGTPIGASFEASVNGTDFTEIGSFLCADITEPRTDNDAGARGFIKEIEFENVVEAQYIRVNYECTGFTWISEFGAYTYSEPEIEAPSAYLDLNGVFTDDGDASNDVQPYITFFADADFDPAAEYTVYCTAKFAENSTGTVYVNTYAYGDLEAAKAGNWDYLMDFKDFALVGDNAVLGKWKNYEFTFNPSLNPRGAQGTQCEALTMAIGFWQGNGGVQVSVLGVKDASGNVLWEHDFADGFDIAGADVVAYDFAGAEDVIVGAEIYDSTEEEPAPPTGDAGMIALAIVSVIALAGAVVIKKR